MPVDSWDQGRIGAEQVLDQPLAALPPLYMFHEGAVKILRRLDKQVLLLAFLVRYSGFDYEGAHKHDELNHIALCAVRFLGNGLLI